MEKPRRLWPWIVTTLIGVPVLYVLSVGVTAYAWKASGENARIREFSNGPFFKPLFVVIENGPESLRRAYHRYIRWCISLGG
jgi:hypothetical protein